MHPCNLCKNEEIDSDLVCKLCNEFGIHLKCAGITENEEDYLYYLLKDYGMVCSSCKETFLLANDWFDHDLNLELDKTNLFKLDISCYNCKRLINFDERFKNIIKKLTDCNISLICKNCMDNIYKYDIFTKEFTKRKKNNKKLFYVYNVKLNTNTFIITSDISLDDQYKWNLFVKWFENSHKSLIEKYTKNTFIVNVKFMIN